MWRRRDRNGAPAVVQKNCFRKAKRPSERMGVGALLAQAKLLDQLPVGVGVGALEIVEQLAPQADHLEQAATRVVVLHVRLEMLSEGIDARGEQRHLDFGRAGVAGLALVLRNDLRSLRNGDGHTLSLWWKAATKPPGIRNGSMRKGNIVRESGCFDKAILAHGGLSEAVSAVSWAAPPTSRRGRSQPPSSVAKPRKNRPEA